MPKTHWQLLPPELNKDNIFQDCLLIAHKEIYNDFFSGDPLANPELGFHLHAYRRTSSWRVVLILTPWMMSRLLFPEKDPHIIIPEGWSGEDRRNSDYQVLGPSLRLGWSGDYMQAHLNYHARLGHYLLQSIALNMQSYATPEEAFKAWNCVIKTRDAYMKRMKKQRPWQKEVSRRALLSKYLT
ncbi:MAG: [NiFe]-hydrogenase assembly chaperone HybE [Candidatus Thiodiazotropha sp. (ex Epidulcina cf. delphinae)]|nr:[NiFe]-hydrogenase assembly chaperone HybE [Candidatus Thiodiazotropha sp. (ex Epidulcina cf. delphinae)]